MVINFRVFRFASYNFIYILYFIEIISQVTVWVSSLGVPGRWETLVKYKAIFYDISNGFDSWIAPQKLSALDFNFIFSYLLVD
jgi:hypothetical protein